MNRARIILVSILAAVLAGAFGLRMLLGSEPPSSANNGLQGVAPDPMTGSAQPLPPQVERIAPARDLDNTAVPVEVISESTDDAESANLTLEQTWELEFGHLSTDELNKLRYSTLMGVNKLQRTISRQLAAAGDYEQFTAGSTGEVSGDNLKPGVVPTMFYDEDRGGMYEVHLTKDNAPEVVEAHRKAAWLQVKIAERGYREQQADDE